jgi:CheY-like chemotaxis protein
MPFDLVAMVDDVVTLVSEKAEEKGIELIVRYAPHIPRRVVGDAGRIRQTLVNLVGNAIKFTHAGHVFVNVEHLGVDAGHARLRLSVEDTGIGISPAKLGSVFEKFTQADGSITRRYGGTGLGLAISKHLVELMHGEIAVTSTEGKGSTFWFALSLPIEDATPAVPPGELAGLRVLVAHPNSKVRAVLCEQVAMWNASVRDVDRGGEAIEALRAARGAGAPFDVAVVAGSIADPAPEALAQAVRSDPSLCRTTLVLLAARDRLADAERSQAGGFDAILTRPARPPQLFAVLAAARRAGASASPP